VDSNIRAVAADEDYITQCRAQGIYPAAYYPHNIHFLTAALVMDGRSKEALEAARKVASKHDHQTMHEPGFGSAHLLKTMPVLTMVRFGRWQEILKEPEPPTDQVFGRAMHHFGRGFALAATGDAAGGARELASLRKVAIEPSLKELKVFDLNSLETLAKIATAMLEGELANRSGRHDEAITAFRRAADLDDNLLYSEPPDWMLPPRQYLAAALSSAGRHAEAERVYREDLKRHRSNGWSLYGLEQALRKQNKQAEADRAKQEFAKAWSRADVPLASSRF
jgi:tetratricopeptide (TPR) repeat protein